MRFIKTLRDNLVFSRRVRQASDYQGPGGIVERAVDAVLDAAQAVYISLKQKEVYNPNENI